MNAGQDMDMYAEAVLERESLLDELKKEQEILSDRFHELRNTMTDDHQILESHKVMPADVKTICRTALTITEIQKRQQEVSEEISSLSESLLSYKNMSETLKALREKGNLQDADYGSILEKITVLAEGVEICFKTGTRYTVK